MSDDDECKRIIVPNVDRETPNTTTTTTTTATTSVISSNSRRDDDDEYNDDEDDEEEDTTTSAALMTTSSKDLNNNHDYNFNHYEKNPDLQANTKSLKWAPIDHQCIKKDFKHSLVPKSHEYEASYEEAFALDLNARERVFFCPNEPIYVQITSYDEEPSLVVLHTNVYTIHVRHGRYSWVIKRKYKQFLKLYEAYALFKTKLNIKNVALSSYLTTTNATSSGSGGSGSGNQQYSSSVEADTGDNNSRY